MLPVSKKLLDVQAVARETGGGDLELITTHGSHCSPSI